MAFNANQPGALADWELYTEIRALTNADVAGANANNANGHCLMARKRTLEHSLWTMGQTKCQSCSGFGHGAKHCPTEGKLK